jgi:hypothetical protein
MTVRQRHGASAYTGLALLVTLGLGALHVAYPFSADQSQTLLGAQALERGGTLYVDLWDLRQPGQSSAISWPIVCLATSRLAFISSSFAGWL